MVRVAGLRWSWLRAEKTLGVATEHEALPWPSGPELHALPPTSSRLCQAIFLEALNSVPLKPWAPCRNVQKWVPGNPKRCPSCLVSPLGWGSSRSVDNSQPPHSLPHIPKWYCLFRGKKELLGKPSWPSSPTKKKKRSNWRLGIWFDFCSLNSSLLLKV